MGRPQTDFPPRAVLIPPPSPLLPNSLSPVWLRERFVGGERGLPVREGEPGLALRPAAVLVPVVDRPEGLSVLLTKRTDHLHHHPGQISFPGGRVERADTSAVMTALRETQEEIGLGAERIELLGELAEYATGTGFSVTPVVGLVHPPFTLQLDAFEVAEAFEVPLTFLLDPANRQRHRMEYQGRMREYYAIPYRDHFIWGATAGILVQLGRFVGVGEGG
ncbi:CoA pyrophosphatase [Pseudothauera nasutitermitis]|uniref:CoA pyrophosphatase n=1 Tax=Pseudothauera nasutitermitis TaxID=2565930 RepID=A0A4S4B3B5_9RHOO|nr:CoA pyrophosphatase [Pseudothauera nasutitermitis]THF67055.1 CoA pyrophosphatase [Pseudothauera nasutitermitis]